ncbi:MAG: hypothetical protein ABR540_13155, partial [Acidimicrobiales bacterium]
PFKSRRGLVDNVLVRRALVLSLLSAVLSALPLVQPAAPALAAGTSPGGRIVTAAGPLLEIADPDGTHVQLLIGDGRAEYVPGTPTFSHDGTKIAYVSGGQTCVIGVDGSGNRCVAGDLGRPTSHPRWSPDDRFLHYSAGSAIFAINLEGWDYRPFLLDPTGATAYSHLEWAPDGRRYVVVASTNGGPRRIAVGAVGDPLVVISNGTYADMEPHWSPDGSRIVYGTQRTAFDQFHVAIVNADGSAPRIIRDDAWAFAWSPDGTQILFGGGGPLATMNPDGTGVVPVPGRSGEADWAAGSGRAVVSTSGGGAHTLALRADGSVSARGVNNGGQLGDGTRADRARPVVVAGLPASRSVSAGWIHSVAAANDGTVWTWGWNGTGQLGNGTRSDATTPGPVPGLSEVVAVSAGLAHTVALRNDGTVWTWGWNVTGQLGDGTTIDRPGPVRANIPIPVRSVAAGGAHTLALDWDGNVWAWGYNGQGQLGVDSRINSLIPVKIPSLARVTAIAAGLYHNLAIGPLGYVHSWGWNGLGQLGDGTTTDRSSPVNGLLHSELNRATTIGAGGAHSVASGSAGTLWTWGYNGQGQLGDGSRADRSQPARVPSPDSVFTVGAGWFHSLAGGTDGRVLAWGYNGQGQLGNGTTVDATRPGFVGV